jgi:hypothetical protein
MEILSGKRLGDIYIPQCRVPEVAYRKYRCKQIIDCAQSYIQNHLDRCGNTLSVLYVFVSWMIVYL